MDKGDLIYTNIIYKVSMRIGCRVVVKSRDLSIVMPTTKEWGKVGVGFGFDN